MRISTSFGALTLTFCLTFGINLKLTAQCPTAADMSCNMAAGQYDNVVIGEVSGDAGQSDGCNDGIVEIVGPPGTNIGCMVVTNSEWAVLIPPNTAIPMDGVFLIACSSDPASNCGVGINGSSNGLIADGTEGDFNSGLLGEIDLDVCNTANSIYYDPAATGFTIDNSGNSDGDQVMLFRPNGTPHDGIYWGTANTTTSGASTIGGASGNADHVTIQISGQSYTLGDNDANGTVNDNPIAVVGGRGDGTNATAVPVLPTHIDCPCNTPTSPGTFTIPSLDDASNIWFEMQPNFKGCNSSFARPGTSGGADRNPTHMDGLVTSTDTNPNGSPSNNGGGATGGMTGDLWTPSAYTPTSCGNAEWGYTDHPTPGQPNNDPSFVFYASTDQVCTVGDMITFTVEVYNYQHVSDNTDILSGDDNIQTGSYVHDPITGMNVPWSTYAVSGETTTMTYTSTMTSSGTFSFGLVWDDYSNCCGTSGLPHSQSNPNECYERETITVQVIEPMTAAPSFSCVDGQVNVTTVPLNATGVLYELLDEPSYLASGGNVVQSNSTGQFLVTTPATDNYFVRVSQAGNCSGPFEASGTVCVFAPPCPEFTAYEACTTPSGNFCPGSSIEIAIEGTNLPEGALIEFVSLADMDTNPYDNPISDVVASYKVPPATISIGSSNVYSGADGNFFAGQDLDGEGGPDQLTFNIPGVNISGQTGLQICIDLAEEDGTNPSDGNESNWDNGSSNSDEFIISAQVDANPVAEVLSIQSDAPLGSSNGNPRVDTDGDSVGDGTEVTATFQTFTSNISGTGSNLDIEFSITLDDGGSDIAFDNIIIKSNENPSGILEIDFDNQNSGYSTSSQFSDNTDDYYGIVSSSSSSCETISITTELCGNLNIAPRISPDQSGCNTTTGGSSEEPTLTPLTYTISCPEASISASVFDVCQADMSSIDIPVSISGGTGPYEITYSVDGVNSTISPISDGGDITITGPTSGEVKVTLVSVSDLGGSMCNGSVNDAEACVNIRPTPTGTVMSHADPTACSPCNGLVTFTFTGNGPFDLEYTVDGGSPQSVSSVNSPYTLTGLCPGVYDIVSIQDEGGCDGTITSNPQTLNAPSGETLSITTAASAVCNDGSGMVDLTSDITFDPAYSASSFYFFGVDPNGLPLDPTNPTTFTGFTLSSSTVTVPSAGTTVYALYIDPMSGCPSSVPVVLSTNASACFTCPTITALSDPADPCVGGSFDLTVSSLNATLMNQTTGGGPFGIQFLAFSGTTAPASAYSGGSSLGIVTNSSLTNTDTEATLNNVGSSLTAGDYQICAILSGVPTDATCRPQVCVPVTVNANPVATVNNISQCFSSAAGTPSLTLTATTGSPTMYSIDYDMAANTAGLVDVTSATSLTGATYAIPSSLAAGTYNGTITYSDVNGCSGTDDFTITINANPVATVNNISQCFSSSASTPTLTLTATTGSPTTYTIDYDMAANTAGLVDVTSATSLTGATYSIPANLASGTYNGIITFSDANGCNGTDDFSITISDNAVATVNNISQCFSNAASTPTLILTATTGSPTMYTIDYDMAANTAGLVDVTTATSLTGATYSIPANLAIGTYNGVITYIEGNGCSGTDDFTITINANPVATVNNIEQCFSSSANTPSLVLTATVGNPTMYTIDYNMAANTAGLVDVTSATSLTGATYAIPTNLAAGTYNGIITYSDANGCSGTDDFTITINANPVATVNNISQCFSSSSSTPSLTLTATTGSPTMYTIDYDMAANSAGLVDVTSATSLTGATYAIPANLAAGIYNGTITYSDVNGCSGTDYFTITINANPVATVNNISQCFSSSSSTPSLTLTATVGSPTMYTIDYDMAANTAGLLDVTSATSLTGATYAIPANLAAGTYNGTITYSDANGCSGTDDFTIIVNANPLATVNNISQCFNSSPSTPSLTLTATVGSPTIYTIDYDMAANTAGLLDITSATSLTGATYAIPANLAAGTYNGTITYSDANDCSGTDAFTIEIKDTPVATINDITNCGPEDEFPFTLNVTSGNVTHFTVDFDTDANAAGLQDMAMIAMTSGAQFTSTNNLPAGVYNGIITLVADNACTVDDPFTITIVNDVNAGINDSVDICNEDPTEFSFDLMDELGGTPNSGGTWTETTSGTPSGVTISGSDGSVNFQGVAPGTYQFRYALSGTSPCMDADATVTVNVSACYDLALTKVLTTASVVKPGDMVTFDITVFNQSDIDAFDVDVQDYFPSCLIYISSVYSSHTSMGAPPTITDNSTNGFEISQVSAMSSVVVTLSFTIDMSCEETSIINNAEITGGSSTDGGPNAFDADSTPGDDASSPPDDEDNNTDETNGDDDFDPAEIKICQTGCSGSFPWNGNN